MFTVTYKNSARSSDAFSVLQNGINAGLFMPQFHGRDHVNAPLWIKLLKTLGYVVEEKEISAKEMEMGSY
jgi:hypothetical protein